MVFSSVIFLFYFLPILLVVYYLLPKNLFKNVFLFIASIVFYAFGAGKLLVLLLAVSFCTWFFSYLIVKTKLKKLFAYLAVCVLIFVLIYYKYLGFIIDNFIPGLGKSFTESSLIMPVGVSFFIFQAISYIVDVYRRNSRYERNPAYVILYITMFPQLISGPLVRYNNIEQQLKSRTFNFERFADGVRRFIIGLAKKVLIANQLSLLVTQILNTKIDLVSPLVAWTGIFAFTLQVFFDFSGYTDMAIGAGKMLGFDLPENFNFPYISRSITEFWRRWHMTLSAWLRDYLFMPLSLSFRRFKNAGVFVSLLITFTVCGMWHGASWNFIIWGAVQGLFLGIEQLFLGKYISKLKGFAVIYAMFIVMTGLVFVMTEKSDEAFRYLKAMFTSGGITPLGMNAFVSGQNKLVMILAVFFCIPVKWPAKFDSGKTKHLKNAVLALLLIAIFILSVMTMVTETYNPFIYFRF